MNEQLYHAHFPPETQIPAMLDSLIADRPRARLGLAEKVPLFDLLRATDACPHWMNPIYYTLVYDARIGDPDAIIDVAIAPALNLLNSFGAPAAEVVIHLIQSDWLSLIQPKILLARHRTRYLIARLAFLLKNQIEKEEHTRSREKYIERLLEGIDAEGQVPQRLQYVDPHALDPEKVAEKRERVQETMQKLASIATPRQLLILLLLVNEHATLPEIATQLQLRPADLKAEIRHLIRDQRKQPKRGQRGSVTRKEASSQPHERQPPPTSATHVAGVPEMDQCAALPFFPDAVQSTGMVPDIQGDYMRQMSDAMIVRPDYEPQNGAK